MHRIFDGAWRRISTSILTKATRIVGPCRQGIRIILVRIIRLRQDAYYANILKYQDLYEEFPSGSFRQLYVLLAYSFNKELYWFCVGNAQYKKGE